jgi:hypothetical protein
MQDNQIVINWALTALAAKALLVASSILFMAC